MVDREKTGRQLTHSQFEKGRQALSKIENWPSEKELRISSVTGNPEAYRMASQLADLVRSAGHKVNHDDRAVFFSQGSGGISITAKEMYMPLATAFEKILSDAGFKATKYLIA